MVKRFLSVALSVMLMSVLTYCILLSSIVCVANAGSTTISDTPNADDITVTNNAKGTSDTVYVSGLIAKDIIKAYNAFSDGKLLGKATASSSGVATVKISQLGSVEGSIYISLTSSGCLESSRVEVEYDAELVSDAPDADDITVTNNAKGTSDTVYVQNLAAGDIVKVYNKETSGTLRGSKTVASSGNDATVTISQLGANAGTVYVAVKSTSMNESARVAVDYVEEATSTAPSEGNITVTNNPAGTSDTVYVKGLYASDVVKVYNAASSGKLLGNATATSTDATVTITQLGTDAASVYVSVASTGKTESSRTAAEYEAEATSDAPDSSNITITNNASGTSDTVYVSGLQGNDVVKVYKSSKGGTAIGNGTVESGKTNITLSISQLGTSAGSVYITVTSTDKSESSCTKSDYSAEETSTAPDSSNITVANNVTGTSDTVYVKGLSKNDIITVYEKATNGDTLGTATVSSSGNSATVTISQLGTSSGSVYVSVTSTGKTESSRTAAEYEAEATSDAPDSSNIIITNNAAGTSDTVFVTGLSSGDVVNVYAKASGGTALGTATVADGTTYATVTISQLGTGSGSVYVSVTIAECLESDRTQTSYAAESQTTPLSADSVSVTNNSGESDTVTVTGLTSGDIVKIYDAATSGTLLGTATVSTYGSSATVTIEQLGIVSRSIYVALTSKNKTESARTEVTYSAEAASAAPNADNITVVNNYLSASTVTVTDLVEDDIVNIYNAASEGTLLGTGAVETYDTEVTISISQLSTSGGYIYVTVTSTGKTESERTAVTYSAKSYSAAPEVSDVTIVNNTDISDTITVKNVSSGTVVNVYDAETGGELLGTKTATSTKVVVTIDQLGADAGTVYISAICSGKVESSRTAVDYDAEEASDAILSGNVTIVNNSGLADTITITGLADGDVINVYKASSGGTAIATATATESSLTTTLTVSQLGTTAGSVYISITCEGKSESSRTEVTYVAESTAPSASIITIVNNAGISDTITVTGLTSGDVVNVYNAAASGTLLGSATVTTGSTTVTISVSQLSSAAGYAYISVTNSGCAESSLTKVSYIAEQTTDAPDEGDIYILNNSSIADTVTVYNLVAGDVVRVYDVTDEELIGRATVASGATQATVSIDELGTSSGSVYVTVKSKGKLESNATEASYSAESKSTAPYAGDITINNNVSIADTIVVSGLDATDVVKVYNASASGTLLGYATVTSGSSSVSISISQLGTGAGTVYVSVTKVGKTESDRTAADYVSETTSNEAHVGNITVVNNPVGTSDTITIMGLTSGDLIQVYDAATDGNLLGSATVSSSGTSVTVTISQLGITAGSVYITITSTGKSKSARTEASYISE